VVNRLIIYKSYKTIKLEDNEIKEKTPLLIAGNLSVFISLFILIKPLINFITYQLNNQESIFLIFSICSIVFIVNAILLLIAFLISKLLITFLIKVDHFILQSVLWFLVSTIIIILTSEFYNQITSSNAFNIY
jgi:hypothetical protein